MINQCDAMHVNGVAEFKIICLHLFVWNGITFCKSASVAQQLILFIPLQLHLFGQETLDLLQLNF